LTSRVFRRRSARVTGMHVPDPSVLKVPYLNVIE
jgi:hypothetical protein